MRSTVAKIDSEYVFFAFTVEKNCEYNGRTYKVKEIVHIFTHNGIMEAPLKISVTKFSTKHI